MRYADDDLMFLCKIIQFTHRIYFQYIVSAPPQGEVLKGMFFPWCTGCKSSELLQAVGKSSSFPFVFSENIFLIEFVFRYRWCCDYAS